MSRDISILISFLFFRVLRHFIAEDLTFNNLYKRGHNNLICYAIGLGLAMLVYRLQKKNIDVEKYKVW